jgi:hypothetical protein
VPREFQIVGVAPLRTATLKIKAKAEKAGRETFLYWPPRNVGSKEWIVVGLVMSSEVDSVVALNQHRRVLATTTVEKTKGFGNCPS